MAEARRYLQKFGTEVKNQFVQNRTILSFEEYLDVFLQSPRQQARNAAQYLQDVFDHYGSEMLDTPTGPLRRYQLFDLGGGDGREGRVAGQEEVQGSIYRLLNNFVRSGRINKLILLHGPNGSAKSSIVAAISRAAESYSQLPEGALYRFNWVFPNDKLVKGNIGFGGKGGAAPSDGTTFAHLEGDALDASLVCELKDHPLYLLPKNERRQILEEACQARASEQSNPNSAFVLSEAILEGELCHKCRLIYAALLSHYRGDFEQVLRHVQIERLYLSRRYQSGLAVVEPQLSVDAAYHQVTADKSPASLPASLQNVVLYEPHGALVSANRGVIEYSDLLKRPLEAYKYLLGTIETAQVPMEHFVLHLDEVLIASSNEKHLSAFKEIPDFASFKGRIELVRVPYLRRVSLENEIYTQRVTAATVGKHVSPHATWVAAMWAVLTRLKKPVSERYTGDLKDVVNGLSPIEKLKLYDRAAAPDRLTLGQAKELKKHLREVAHESDDYPNYEGRLGASAREIKTVLFNAAQSEKYKCLNAQAVLEELEALTRDQSVYEFLQQEVVSGYHDHDQFVKVVEAEYLDTTDEEIRDSMGLVSETQYRDLFSRYISIVSAWVSGDKIRNRVTGAYDKPDENVMTEMEAIVMGEGDVRQDFRRSLISTIGAHKLDHPDDIEIDYTRIFPDLFRRLRDHYFGERRKQIRKVRDNFLRYLNDEKSSLSAKELTQVEAMLATLKERYHYCDSCSRDAILFLMRRRYAD